MIKKLLILLVLVVGVFAGVAANQPDQFKIERNIKIEAPAATVFAQVNDYRGWGAWSPWEKMDPNMKTSLEGPIAGVGAILHWKGNSEVGEGTMTIAESKTNELVGLKLDFKEPMEATSTAQFTFTPQGAGTVVSWSMSGLKNFIQKAMGLVMNCDKMIGEQFERGLADLKTVSEGFANQNNTPEQTTEETIEETPEENQQTEIIEETEPADEAAESAEPEE